MDVFIFSSHGTAGLVVIDPSAGHPLKYDDLTILESAVATSHVRLELDVPQGKGWRRTGSYIDTEGESGLGDAWRQCIRLRVFVCLHDKLALIVMHVLQKSLAYVQRSPSILFQIQIKRGS